MSRYAKEIEITEYDIQSSDPELQADFLRDYLTINFSHPSVSGFTMWGFWDGAHWKGNAPIFYKDFSLKKSGEMYKRLVFGDWWTNASGAADQGGRYTVRGFKGEYEITVTHQGKTRTIPAKLNGSGSSVKINLDERPSAEARLASLSYGGKPVPGFEPDASEITVMLPYGQDFVSTVRGVAMHQHAKVRVKHPADPSGVAAVEVTAEDGRTVKLYTVRFAHESLRPLTGSRISIMAATASGTMAGAPEYAIDSASDTSWRGASLTLDLGEVESIGGIALTWDQTLANSIVIETSIDGSDNSWWRVATLDTPGLSTEPEPYSFKDLPYRYSDVFGRYVRIRANGTMQALRGVDVFAP